MASLMRGDPRRLIGLNGRLHSGKDTVCEMIAQAAGGLTVERAGFADKLKMSACAALGIPFTDAADAVRICNQIKECQNVALVDNKGYGTDHYITGREYLQYYGTEAHRDVFGDMFWVDALLPVQRWELVSCFPNSDVVVVTDVRFDNEAQRILDLGGEIWWIDAEGRLGPLPADAHASEQPLATDLITVTLDNNTDLDHLKTGVYALLHGG